MKKIRKIMLTATVIIAGMCLAGIASAKCEYHLNFENEAGQSVEVQKVKWKKKVVGDWKPWKDVEIDLFTLEDKAEKELKRKESTAVCYRFRWKFEWRCAGSADWHEGKLGPDNPDNDRVSNYFVQFDGCAASDMKKSQDGGAF